MTPAVELLVSLRGRGVAVESRGAQLRVRPASGVAPDELEALRRYKAELLELLALPTMHGAELDSEIRSRLLAMSLELFAREGQPIEVRVRWWPKTLFFAPTLRDAEALCASGVARARIWTTSELNGLLGASTVTTSDLLTVMRAREAFDGEVIEVRRRGRA